MSIFITPSISPEHMQPVWSCNRTLGSPSITRMTDRPRARIRITVLVLGGAMIATGARAGGAGFGAEVAPEVKPLVQLAHALLAPQLALPRQQAELTDTMLPKSPNVSATRKQEANKERQRLLDESLARTRADGFQIHSSISEQWLANTS